MALENLAIIEERDLVGNVRDLSGNFLSRLKGLAEHPLAIEARGAGLIGALELAPREGFAPGMLGPKLFAILQNNGLIARAIGDSLALCPPMITTQSQINDIFDIFERSIEEFQTELSTH